MTVARAPTRLLGVDFTSAPRRAKPITVARARLEGNRVEVEAIAALDGFEAFERLLTEPGPWVGGFDFPFGLPRAAVAELGWPLDWSALVTHCAAMSRATFRARLDEHRNARAPGDRYLHRGVDRAAGSHSALKLVNPPVALMFLEGAPRLLRAGVTVAGMLPGDPQRIALEAYPGHVARAIKRASYKSDTRAKQTPARASTRADVLAAMIRGDNRLGLALAGASDLIALAQVDASGDTLDAMICAMQAGWAAQRPNYGYAHDVDPLEGWIAGVAAPCSPASQPAAVDIPSATSCR